jgi:cytochrome c
MNIKTFLFVTGVVVMLSGIAEAQDVAAGQKSFNKCRACHQVGETAKNGVGPQLNGLFGRKAGTVDGFKYSDANRKSDLIWDETNFSEYIKDPKKFMPGNTMTFIGIRNEQEIKDLIAFLKQHGPDGKK